MASPSKRGSSQSPSCAESLVSSPKWTTPEARSTPNSRTRPSSYSWRQSAASWPRSSASITRAQSPVSSPNSMENGIADDPAPVRATAGVLRRTSSRIWASSLNMPFGNRRRYASNSAGFVLRRPLHSSVSHSVQECLDRRFLIVPVWARRTRRRRFSQPCRGKARLSRDPADCWRRRLSSRRMGGQRAIGRRQ